MIHLAKVGPQVGQKFVGKKMDKIVDGSFRNPAISKAPFFGCRIKPL